MVRWLIATTEDTGPRARSCGKVPPFLLLDVARGWAALSVAVYHSTMAFLERNPDYARQPYYALTSVGYLGVILFFLISGYCIIGTAYHALLSGQSVRRYAWNRLRRIYPPYLATCFLAIVVEIAVVLARRHGYEPPANYYAPPHPESILFWASNFLLLQAELYQFCLVMVFWSLSYEIAFYAIIGIFLFAARRWPRGPASKTSATSLLFSANAMTAFFSLAWVTTSPATCPFPFDRWYQFGLGAMLFGLVAARYRSEEEVPQAVMTARVQMLIAVGLTAALTMVQLRFGAHRPQHLDGIACLGFLGLLAVLYPYDRKLAWSRGMRPLVWLGTFSYSLYLTHTIGLPFITTGMRHLGFDYDWYWVTSLVQIASSILGGWIFYLLVERHFISKHQREIVV